MDAALPPPSMAGGPCRPRSSSKSIAPNRVPLVFRTNSGSINEPLMGGSFFAGNGEGIEALAKPIFVRGASPFYGSGPAAPFNGSGPAAPFNGSGTAARPPLSTAGRTYSRPARLAAILRLLLLFLNTERNVSRSFILEGGALPRWKFFCCIFIFGGYFCG